VEKAPKAKLGSIMPSLLSQARKCNVQAPAPVAADNTFWIISLRARRLRRARGDREVRSLPRRSPSFTTKVSLSNLTLALALALALAPAPALALALADALATADAHGVVRTTVSSKLHRFLSSQEAGLRRKFFQQPLPQRLHSHCFAKIGMR
jgi:hypothetical protein